MASRLKQVAATGQVEAGPAYLKSVTLTPAAAVATLVVDNSTDGAGTDLIKLQAPASGQSVRWASADGQGVLFTTAIYATLTGAGAVASFELG